MTWQDVSIALRFRILRLELAYHERKPVCQQGCNDTLFGEQPNRYYRFSGDAIFDVNKCSQNDHAERYGDVHQRMLPGHYVASAVEPNQERHERDHK